MESGNEHKLEKEFRAMIKHYVNEHDITYAEVIAALEFTKASMLEQWLENAPRPSKELS